MIRWFLRKYRAHRYQFVANSLIPEMLMEDDPIKVIEHTHILIDQLRRINQDITGFDRMLMYHERVVSPFLSLEEAYRHVEVLQRRIVDDHPVEMELLTSSNLSCSFREWMTNSKGYHLTEVDFFKWIDLLESYIVSLSVHCVSNDMLKYKPVLAYTHRLRNLLATWFQFYHQHYTI